MSVIVSLSAWRARRIVERANDDRLRKVAERAAMDNARLQRLLGDDPPPPPSGGHAA